LPALPLCVLAAKDALVLGPGLHSYVTERVIPYVGPPPAAFLGQRCPACRIPFDETTRVATHRCGVAYHAETEESHSDVAPDDRLQCIEKVQSCLSCGRRVTLVEELVWDPATFSE
jgi:hypothetical protein